MLPEVYCDFLLALYTNMDETEDNKVETSWVNTSSWLKTGELFLLIILLPIALLAVYATLFPPYVKILILFIFILSSIWEIKGFKRRQSMWYNLALAIFLLLIFLLSIVLIDTYLNLIFATHLIIVINFVSWFILGKKLDLKYLQIASIFGILLESLFLFYN